MPIEKTVPDDEDVPCCRVCRLEADPTDPDDEPLITPCKCNGSIAHIHQSCLEQWLNHQGKKPGEATCELCTFQFVFDPTYKKGTPDVLSPCDLLNASVAESGSCLCKLCTVFISIALWFCILPLSLSHSYFWLQGKMDLRSTPTDKSNLNRARPYFVPSEYPTSMVEAMSDIQLGIFFFGAV